MTKGKTLLLLATLVVVAVFAGVFLLVQNLDSLVKTAIETFGSQATRTSVQVATVSIDLREGRGTIGGLTVANPQGFSSRPVFSLGEISVDLDTATLTSDVPVITEIRVGAPALLFEVDASGQSNLEQLKSNLAATTSSKPSAGSADTAKDGKRLRIARLVIDGGQGTLDLTAVGGKSWDARVPPITLTDLGGSQGLTGRQLGERVTAALLKELEQTALRSGVEDALREKLAPAAGELQQKLDEKLGEGSSDALKKLLGR